MDCIIFVEGIIVFGIILMLLHFCHSKTGMNCTCCGFHQSDRCNPFVIIEISLKIGDIITDFNVFYLIVIYCIEMKRNIIYYYLYV